MKRTLIKVTVMGILLAGGIYLMEEKNTSLSDVALDNIEALAAGECGFVVVLVLLTVPVAIK